MLGGTGLVSRPRLTVGSAEGTCGRGGGPGLGILPAMVPGLNGKVPPPPPTPPLDADATAAFFSAGVCGFSTGSSKAAMDPGFLGAVNVGAGPPSYLGAEAAEIPRLPLLITVLPPSSVNSDGWKSPYDR